MEHTTIPRKALASDPRVSIARVTTGLTLYLCDPLSWARTHAGRALDLFLGQLGSEDACWYTTSLLDEWRVYTPDLREQLVKHASSDWLLSPRHLFSFQLANDVAVPTLGFTYREVDERKGGASVLELSFPQHEPATALLQHVLGTVRDVPFLCGTGGFVGRWNSVEKVTAFHGLHAWCSRYLGLDIQDAEQMAWHAREGIPGTGWLTLIGEPVLQTLGMDAEALLNHVWKHDIQVVSVGRGVLIQAGAEPTLGDVNELTYPAAYAEVAQHLAAAFVQKPPAYWGPFAEDTMTEKWLRRFLEPQGWQSVER